VTGRGADIGEQSNECQAPIFDARMR
jgi:hypothetical protein